MENITSQVVLVGQGLLYVVVILAFVWLARVLHDMRSSFSEDNEVEQNSNLAVGMRRGGLFFATAIALMGPLFGPDNAFLTDFGILVLEGAVVTVFLLSASWVTDNIILNGIDNDKEVEAGNVAVGLVEAGSFIATGLIAFASFAGEGGNVIVAIGFFAIGQAVLVLAAWLYEAVTPYNILDLIRKGKTSAGLLLASKLVALAVILKAALSGNFTSWATDLPAVAFYAAVGLILLPLVEMVSDHIFLPNTDIRTEVEIDNNVSAIVLSSSVVVAAAFIIGAAVL